MILAISGSLKRSSVNTAALRAAAFAAARDGIAFTLTDAPRALPHFDPDLEVSPPTAVEQFRSDCEAASAVLLAVPEYAFGIPGAFKNALDWTVRSGSLYGKPVAVLDVAPPGRGAHLREALDGVLRALDLVVTHYALPITANDRDADGEIVANEILEHLRAVVAELSERSGATDRGQ
jgi:chromate reductase, NAD(P)H dehydrogenase (quinone)